MPDERPEVRKHVMADWLDDLLEFAPIHVANACDQWRRSQNRRPTPADIRKLAQESRDTWERPIKPRAPRLASADGYRPPPMPADPTTVRPNWKQIRFPDLAAAERDLFRHGVRNQVAEAQVTGPLRAALSDAARNFGVEV